MILRVCDIIEDSIVDGPGLRLAVFVQGCNLHCPGCHNPQTWPIHGGYEMSVDEIIDMAVENKLLQGITITGGEPFDQATACAVLAEAAHENDLDVWVYTGYTLEKLLMYGHSGQMALLREADVLVDGPFDAHKKSHDLKWRGSSNQRVIDIKKTLGSMQVAEYEA